jgi:hypothetical protein
MESLLVGVTVISLLLAVTMSAIAWSLWQAERERTAARAEALEALAFADLAEERAVAPSPRPASNPAPSPRAQSASDTRHASPAFEDVSSDETWDFALGGTRMDEADLQDHAARGGTRLLAEEMFHTDRPSATGGRLWLALAAVALVVTAGVVTYRAVHSPELRAVVSASRTHSTAADASANAANGAHALQLLSLRHSNGADGAFVVTGLVQNPANGESVDQVEAVVYLFDDDGRYFASGKAPLEVPGMAPGDESPFTIKVDATSGVSRYRVGFRRGDGRVLAHVDRRGQLPDGTSGDAIDAQPAFATPAGAIRSTEGALVR